eukprot:PhF_6_TR2297/c0_g1_i1/m.4026
MQVDSLALTGGTTLSFAALRLLIRAVLVDTQPQFSKLSTHGQRRLELYILSLVHASVCTAGSLHGLLRPLSERSSTTPQKLLSFMLGYFLHDLSAVIPTARQYPADVIHHVLAIAMLIPLLKSKDEEMFKLTPGILLAELSTVVLDLMYMSKELKWNKSFAAVAVLPKLFAVTFFFCRVLWLPMVIQNLRTEHKETWKRQDIVVRGSLMAALLLNLYWAVLIAKKAIT